jgi:hypothetical protein
LSFVKRDQSAAEGKNESLYDQKIEIDKIVIMNYFLAQSSFLLTQAMAIRERKSKFILNL